MKAENIAKMAFITENGYFTFKGMFGFSQRSIHVSEGRKQNP